MRLSSNEIIQANQVGIVKFPTNRLLTKGKTARVLLNLKNSSLISLGQFTNDNCITVLKDDEINIYKKIDSTKGELDYSKHLQPKQLIGHRSLIYIFLLLIVLHQSHA